IISSTLLEYRGASDGSDIGCREKDTKGARPGVSEPCVVDVFSSGHTGIRVVEKSVRGCANAIFANKGLVERIGRRAVYARPTRGRGCGNTSDRIEQAGDGHNGLYLSYLQVVITIVICRQLGCDQAHIPRVYHRLEGKHYVLTPGIGVIGE